MQEIAQICYLICLGILGLVDWKDRNAIPSWLPIGVFGLAFTIWVLFSGNVGNIIAGMLLAGAGVVLYNIKQVGDADILVFASLGFVFGWVGVCIVGLAFWVGSVLMTLAWVMKGKPEGYKGNIPFIPLIWSASVLILIFTHF